MQVFPKIRCHQTFGCPAYSLNNYLQADVQQPKWEAREKFWTNLRPSPRHASSGYQPELTENIDLSTITHPVWQIIRDSEAVNHQFTNIISVEDYIRSEERQGKKRLSFIGHSYITWTTSPYNIRYQWRVAGHQCRCRNPPTISARTSTFVRGSRRASILFICEDITKNQGDVR